MTELTPPRSFSSNIPLFPLLRKHPKAANMDWGYFAYLRQEFDSLDPIYLKQDQEAVARKSEAQYDREEATNKSLQTSHVGDAKKGCQSLQDKMRTVPHRRRVGGQQDRSQSTRPLRAQDWLCGRVFIHRCKQAESRDMEGGHSGEFACSIALTRFGWLM